MSAAAGRFSNEEFLQFNEQLLGLLRARVPMDEGLRKTADEIRSPRLYSLARGVADELERGLQLSEALEKRPENFPAYYLSLLKAAEAGGSLAEVLHHVVTETRRRIDHRRAVLTSLIYPAVVFAAAAVVGCFICVKIIPSFVEVYGGTGMYLPAPTRLVVDFAGFVEHRFGVLALGVGVFAVLVVLVAVLPSLRYLRDDLLLNAPVVGRLVYNDTIVSFCRCMGFLLARKIPMPQALILTRSVMRNAVAGRFVGRVLESVGRGGSLSTALEEHAYLPNSTYWMIRLSEDRGDLPDTLTDLAGFYVDKQQQLRQTVQGTIEPAIIAALGLVTGSLVIILYLPLFSVGSYFYW